MRQAVILVGGRGTRLGEIARDTPKPLMPIIGEVRFLDYLIENIARHGVEEILLLAGHRSEQVVARYDGALTRGALVRVIVEPEPAGTAGALRHAQDRLDDVFLMTNGDSILDCNYLALAQALQLGDQAALALRHVPDAARYGRVEAPAGRVLAFHEKDAAFAGAAWISGGVYVLRRSVLDLIERTPASIETYVFPKLAASGAIAAFKTGGYFLDIGLPDTLAQARAELPAQMRRGAVFFDRDGTLVRDNGYTHRVEDLEWMPGAVDAIRACNDAGRLAIVVTNQAGIARGLYAEADMRRFHAHMQAQLRQHGAHVDAFYHCPHHGEGVIAKYTHADHPDRKPNPGMLRRALAEWPITPETSFMVGDSDIDVAAANAVGLAAAKVAPGELLATVQSHLAQAAPKRGASGDVLSALRKRAETARAWLFEAALPLWWTRGYDRQARCFHERLSLQGEPLAAMARRVRVQARQTVVYAYAGQLGWDGPWREATEAGARVLLERGLRGDGGPRHLLNAQGVPCDDRRDLYDAAFITLALSEAARSLGDRPDLIRAAEALVGWVENAWGHPAGGFLEGDISSTPPRRQNPHMHMFEALLALYQASGAAAQLDRANAIARLLRERLFDAEYSALREFFDMEWRPIGGEEGRIVEPGHQFEWSWLLHLWRKLGGEGADDIAERLRLHGELYGVDHASGAPYDEIYIEGLPRARGCRFWPHAERLKANLARYEASGDPEAIVCAAQAFDTLFSYCDTPTRGLWRDRRQPDGGFIEEDALASSFYHAMIALSELIRVAGDAPSKQPL